MPLPAAGSLRILHLSTATTWRGGEQQLAYLALELRRLAVGQLIFCPIGSPLEKFCQKEKLEYAAFEKKPFWKMRLARQLRRACLEYLPTHLHTHDSHAHTMAVLAAAFFQNKTLLIVHRRVDFPVGQHFFSRWKYNHPAVRRIVCVSEAIRRVMLPAIREPEKLAVVHSGINLKRFQPEKKGDRLRTEFDIPAGHFLVANVSALAPHKDYPTFVRTAEILLKENFPATFLAIGGDGGETENLKKLIREKGLEGKIVLTGFRNDVAEVLPEVDLLLFTSRTEGLGTSLLDAFACGVPVVATAAGGIPEVVENGVSGLLAPPGDAETLARQVRNVLTDNILRKKITAGGHEKVRHYSVTVMAEQMLEIYVSV